MPKCRKGVLPLDVCPKRWRTCPHKPLYPLADAVLTQKLRSSGDLYTDKETVSNTQRYRILPWEVQMSFPAF